jgi:hypothetical protein
MRHALSFGSLLVFVVALQLLTATDSTHLYFAWTIEPPISAAFLGASYLGSLVLLFLASRQRFWSHARIAISPTLAFLPLMVTATFIHIDRFHLHASEVTARVAGWGWVVLYSTLAAVVVWAVFVSQRGVVGTERAAADAIAPSLRWGFAVEGAVLIPIGAALYVAPGTIGSVWPWSLTPLTGRAVGAWLVAVGVGALHVAWLNDRGRIRIGVIAYAVLALLQIGVLVRYADAVEWDDLRTWAYLLALVAIVTLNVLAMRGGARASSSDDRTRPGLSGREGVA